MKRNNEIKIRLSREELDSLTKKVRKTNLSREAFCREVLNGTTIKQAPPAEYYDLMRQVRLCGSHLNQILAKANTLGFLDVPMLRGALKEHRKTEEMLWEVFGSE